ncbi:LOW QUALITY PROTEIN: LZTFL1 isoform 5 [Pongo abelii]|uniref:LZTFL1 isoform 4 n=1 Tax=Pongo abelii TaxID=9601 RepID=A0A2J8TFD8_PONAB|nr:LOW QUALITY PROTEIN: LZTFL1 isoform 4 [Pongo abelii]PNJ31776.1 LOW QUALITY PROTEIN: LZTFL1 isoform 5 [Pongo abelii]
MHECPYQKEVLVSRTGLSSGLWVHRIITEKVISGGLPRFLLPRPLTEPRRREGSHFWEAKTSVFQALAVSQLAFTDEEPRSWEDGKAEKIHQFVPYPPFGDFSKKLG